MAEVSFYVLAAHNPQKRFEFACKLVEKIYRSGQNCYVLTDTVEQARYLDDLLWTFRAGSFIPHQLYQGLQPELTQTVLLGNVDAPAAWQKNLVNLSGRYPTDIQHTEKILEILDSSEETRRLGRVRYRHYQHLGLPIATHQMAREH